MFAFTIPKDVAGPFAPWRSYEGGLGSNGLCFLEPQCLWPAITAKMYDVTMLGFGRSELLKWVV